MTTLEDIFCDYGADSKKVPVSCSQQGSNKIAKYQILDYDSDFCIYESFNRKIRRNIIENLQVKHYIKIGEECPICYDAIHHRNEAFLTDYGHAFHYHCVINYDYTNSFKKEGVYCPICRGDMGLYDNLKDRYKGSENSFDNLEDFEVNQKNKLPKICFDLHRVKYNHHFYRMDYYNCYYCMLG